jgi:hypothetical protein
LENSVETKLLEYFSLSGWKFADELSYKQQFEETVSIRVSVVEALYGHA